MIRIYYDNKQAIIINERTKTYRYVSRQEAQLYAKLVNASLSQRQALNQREELLIGWGYKNVG